MALMTHPGAGWRIRSYQGVDHVQLEALFLDCLEDFPWRAKPADEIIRLRQTMKSSLCLVADEEQAGLVGFLTLERDKAYVPHLFVHRDWRFCGVASGLLDVARDLARASLQLDVDIQNDSALRAYKALGWVEKVGATTSRPEQRRLTGP